MLEEFKDLFVEPSSLPPKRAFDHAIPLKPNLKPINVHSYRYPPKQKPEIENLVKEMLQQSIIHPSHSPFASPVLVKKKNGSWRFCIDYYQLNSIIIKDKFPIPIIKDLLDELKHAALFQN